jgi:hypothetical protein
LGFPEDFDEDPGKLLYLLWYDLNFKELESVVIMGHLNFKNAG